MSKFALILSFFIALFMSACTNATFIQSFIQTSNEGILSDRKNNEVLKFPFKILANFELPWIEIWL